MAYDQHLAERITKQLSSTPHVHQKQMFGGLGFMLHGNMVCGVLGADFIARIGAEAYAAALREPGVRPFDLTGRPMRGWALVSSRVLDTESQLSRWVERTVAYARTLPPKSHAARADQPADQG